METQKSNTFDPGDLKNHGGKTTDNHLKVIGLSVIPLMDELKGALCRAEMTLPIRRSRIRRILKYIEKARYHLDELTFNLNMDTATHDQRKALLEIFYGPDAGRVPQCWAETRKNV